MSDKRVEEEQRESEQLAQWAEMLGVTVEELRSAVSFGAPEGVADTAQETP